NRNSNSIVDRVWQRIDQSTLTFVVIALVLRCINSVLIITYFDPDEYWQSLEVAHHSVFGYGYLTWEWDVKIRSFMHPSIYAALFHLLKLLNIDTPYLVYITPKLLSGVAVAVCDVYLYKLANSMFGQQVAKWTLICHYMSWYTFVCLVRSYSNSIETILFVISLYYWPLPGKNYRVFNNIQITVIITTIAFMIRPTTALMWLYLVPLYMLTSIRSMKQLVQFLFRDVLLAASITLAMVIVVDYCFYKEITLVPYNFLYYNIVRNFSALYGTHPFHWYFTNALPVVAFTLLPLVILGCQRLYTVQQRGGGGGANRLHLVGVTLVTVTLYSCLAHKEFRFIFPIVPLMMIYAGYYISTSVDQQPITTIVANTGTAAPAKTRGIKNHKAILLLLLLNIPMAMFFAHFHQRSPIDVMHYIREEISPNHQTNSTSASIHFIMSCHATPYQSYVHNPHLSLKILECPPPLNEEDGMNERDLFSDNPQRYFIGTYISSDGDNAKSLFKHHALPEYFVLRHDYIPVFEEVTQVSSHYQHIATLTNGLDITSTSVYQRLRTDTPSR
ncbi:hypothetical protein SAMD00019534_058310, partial [Acytostelium subglobosum LB1]|uniref:hypothetical protein n=1 Tax=Acytostelium subglobosum LB1 TaxID=1410327 RepID=UPI0006448658